MFRIKDIMRERGITSKELAQRMGVTPQYISNVIRESGSVSVNVLSRIAEELNVPVSSLFEDYVVHTQSSEGLSCPHCGNPIHLELKLSKG